MGTTKGPQGERTTPQNGEAAAGAFHSSVSAMSSSEDQSVVSSLSGGRSGLGLFRLSAPQVQPSDGNEEYDEEQQPSQPTREWEEDPEHRNSHVTSPIAGRQSFQVFQLKSADENRRISHAWGDLAHPAGGGSGSLRPAPLIHDMDPSAEMKPVSEEPTTETPKQGPSKILERIKKGITAPNTALTDFHELSQARRKATSPEKRKAQQLNCMLRWIFGAMLLLLLVAVSTTIALMAVESPESNDSDRTSIPSAAPTAASPTVLPSVPPTAGPPSVPPTFAPTLPPPLDTLESIQRSGQVRCGVVEFPGFSVKDDNDESTWIGMNADWCRAIAAAALGNPNAVVFREVTAVTRFQALQAQEIDVLMSGTTVTLQRNVHEPSTGAAFDFSTPYIYDGLTFAGDPMAVECVEDQDTTSAITGGKNCTNVAICTVDSTTHQSVVSEWIPEARIVAKPTTNDAYIGLATKECNVMAGEQMQLAERIVRDNSDYTGDYAVAGFVYSKEPIALVTRSDDTKWSDFVNSVVMALFYAEQEMITQFTAADLGGSDLFGHLYDRAYIDAVSAVGNYGQVYQRHVEEYVTRADVNKIHSGGVTTGLHYSLPFGDIEALSPNPSGMHSEVTSRGYLKCGISEQVDSPNGIDVDMCRALSAAIFDGVFATVEYVEVPASRAFVALRNGEVDVLTRLTATSLASDVREQSTSRGYTFSPPLLYDALAFGGLSDYVKCAYDEDWQGGICQNVRICVVDGTYWQDQAASMFPQESLLWKDNWQEVVGSLQSGDCNVVAGGAIDVSLPNVQKYGYQGNYEAGTSPLLPHIPLSVVTTEEDHHWSAFVRWIVNVLIYAEEEGIEQASASQLPVVHNFGRVNLGVFRDAVSAVGNYGEIYERNIQEYVPRSGLNHLNSNPLGPQNRPWPGFQ